jgi:hypothetical protein
MNKIKKDDVVPELKIVSGAVYDYCATYIKEDDIDLDLEADLKESPKEEIKFQNDLCDNAETSHDGKLNFTEIISKLSKEQATSYSDWFYVGVSLINLYCRKTIKRGEIYNLFDLFSCKEDNYDADSVNMVIDTNIHRFDGKGYGIKYFLDCLKVDDIEYYKSITKKNEYMIMNGFNDDIGASEIVINHYKNSVVICKGVLYVNL